MKDSRDNLLSALPSSDILTQCMHCGLCLATCPTYELTKMERSSPRGRIRLIKYVAEGRAEISEEFINEMNFCLDCQACETACPAGVKYGKMVEGARVLISESGKGDTFAERMKRFFLNKILARPSILAAFSFIMALYQKSGLRYLIRKSKVLSLFPGNLVEIEKLSPEFNFISNGFPAVVQPESRVSKHRVAFHEGCLMKHAYESINKSTVYVLAKNNCAIEIPKKQVCCGSLHAHNGEMETALNLAKQNIDSFESVSYDFLISNSAGCGAFMKEYGHLLENDPVYSERAKKFSSRIKDILEFLAEIPIEKGMQAPDEAITYHDACHLCHTQKITVQPRQVLGEIPGVQFTELEESTWCCGSAGIYNILNYDSSMKFLERKMVHIRNTGAKTVLTGNPGCIGQINYGISQQNADIEVLHPVEFIHKSYKNGEN